MYTRRQNRPVVPASLPQPTLIMIFEGGDILIIRHPRPQIIILTRRKAEKIRALIQRAYAADVIHKLSYRQHSHPQS
jgi:hypothetical protein